VPTRITRFYHPSQNATARASIDQAYDTAKSHAHDLLANRPQFKKNGIWLGKLESANAGGVAFKVDTPLTIPGGTAGDGTIYLHFKCDSGTLTVDVSNVIWSE